MSNLFLMPRYVFTGQGALDKASEDIKLLGKKALIVTDDVMIKLDSISNITNLLDKLEVNYSIYHDVNGEPTDVMVNNGIKQYKDNNCDFLIALGGGSPIDTMKAIGAMITNSGEINDYLGKIIEKETPPLVAIPTTAGTGSEATQFTIITDTEKNIKMLLKGPYLIPTIAVIDPIFTITSPKNVTSSTGLDALTHAIESYTSKLVQPMSEIFSLSAVKKIFDNLLEAYNNGKNVNARTEMSIAALQAGIAFNNSSVTIVHGMSRPIGALFHVPHGLSNAMLLTDCLDFILSGAPDKFCTLARTIGVYEKNMSDIQAGEKFIEAVRNLCTKLNVQTLQKFGVEKSIFMENLDKMAEDALQSGSPQNTRREVKKEDIIEIYKGLWK
ncbi:iron-containing alcohol dehydrogenase [Clostridium tyrobutyricum]|uniref:Fe-containing alcohol dehydrogenase n=1 Tax=Clostridium tyrobutyricum DIVETGP TaxID=1408889 RepID=W6N738_CLOTY|nr:iron-containing alcohol dehydrogenase [Clostridium tyrobutyricum]AND83801.1 iron-containing alcohol dehydrogenase [Clostridium tyrobutyricum]ANP68557.1 alcohol dehydrogenase [Clostridium tyrobutyricum]MBR9647382.1 iron-containing alcohol dehydrogenase [Clostridium tyrobutyricum]MBV4423470.1 iron-containing alcohol dehydrogenase [Clostridium tyrobutyricum]MBV4428409.1 iron-containing alcohol dehydrogenase [Clostridium tyrobutyricum]